MKVEERERYIKEYICNKTIFRNVTIFFINLYKGFDKSLWEIMKIQNCPSQLSSQGCKS